MSGFSNIPQVYGAEDVQRLERMVRVLRKGLEIAPGGATGIAFSNGVLSIDLKDSSPGLELTATGLAALVQGLLSIDASGIKISDQAQATVIGRGAGVGTGAPAVLTAAQLLAVIQTVTNLDDFDGTNWEDLSDAGDTTLHFHSADRARANHTGTQTASTISDFDTQVRTSRLDQMAAPAATVDLSHETLDNIGQASLQNSNEPSGAMNSKTAHEVHTLSLATTSDTSIDLPANVVIDAVQMNVNTAVTDDGGDDTWSAELHDGSSMDSITSGKSPSLNAKVDKMFAGVLTDATTNIRFTPNGGSFTAGVIEVVVYYRDLTSMADA